MISIYDFYSRNKRSMITIKTSEMPAELLAQYLDPINNEKLPDNVTFKIAKGKKAYDIIGLHESWFVFFSQKVIDTLSNFIDMSKKCQPLKISELDQQYYYINNLKAFSFHNHKELRLMYEPKYYGVKDTSIPIFGIKGTSSIMVTEDVKNALLKNKLTNIELVEGFGCSFEEYIRIRMLNFTPEVHAYRDK